MSSLASVVYRRDSFRVDTAEGPQDIYVYGLRYADIVFIVQEFAEIVGELYFRLVLEGGKDLNLDTVLAESPKFVATVIAAGCHDLGVIEQAYDMPAGTQLEALTKIFKLTFQGDHDLKKIAEIVSGVLGTMESNRPAPSESGSGASASS